MPGTPDPAVGGGTSIAMVGAYVLAQELVQAGRDYPAGLRPPRMPPRLQQTDAGAAQIERSVLHYSSTSKRVRWMEPRARAGVEASMMAG
jgi:hypothetical protein